MKIYKILGAGTAALALLAASYSAQAADIPRPVYKGVRSVVAYYNWTGFYVGINGGYMWGKTEFTGVGGGTFSTSPNGWLVGGTVGFNYQVGSWVLGFEGDYNWVDLDGTDASVVCGASCQFKNTWLEHGARPRRLCLRSLAALPHRRRCLRTRQHRQCQRNRR